MNLLPLLCSPSYQSTVTGYERCIGLKNSEPKKVREVFSYIRNTLGRKVPIHNDIGIGVVEQSTISVQGFWRNTAALVPKELPETMKLRARRRSEFGLQDTINDVGISGVIRITQKLLEKQALAKQAALDSLPKVEKVRATE